MKSPSFILGWMIFLLVAGILHLVFTWRWARKGSGRQPVLGRILVIAILLRLPFLFMEPVLSDDVWRNIWDGRVQIAGFNPYLYSPQDDHLAELRDDIVWPRINHPQYRTIYPPLGQISAAAASAFSKMSGMPELFAWKLLVVAIELLGMGLLGLELVRRKTVRWLALWAWSPLAIFEFAGGGHIDGIALGLSGVSAALWLRGRASASGAIFAGAVLTKFLPLPAAVGFVGAKGSMRAAIAAMAIAALLTLPYVAAGPHIVEQLGVYAGNWEFNGVLNRWLGIDTWGYGLTAVATSAGLPIPWIGFEKGIGRVLAWAAVMIAGLIAAKCGSDPFVVARRTLVVFLAIQPTVYPWYLANLLPFLCLAPSWSVVAWLAIAPLTYDVVYRAAVTGAWVENHFLQEMIFGIAVVLFAIEYYRGRRRHA